MNFDEANISRISICAKIPQPAGRVRHFDCRQEYGLLFVEYGTLYYEHNGQRFISDREHALFIPRGITYSLHCTEDSLSYVINFAGCEPCDVKTIQSYPLQTASNFLDLLNSLEQLWLFKPPQYYLKSMSILYEILTKLCVAKHSPNPYTSRYAIIHKSISYLEHHFSDSKLTNDILAAQSSISTVYFRKLFEDCYGMAPMQYVRRKRMEKAQILLKSGYFSVSETAYAVGFNSVHHFCRAFKQHFNMTPGAYMSKFSNSGEDS